MFQESGRGGDLIEGKKTLIMIHAFANDVDVDVFGRKDATPEADRKVYLGFTKERIDRVCKIQGRGDGNEGQAGSECTSRDGSQEHFAVNWQTI